MTKTVTGLIETHSWVMHLRRGDSVALSLAENTHDETCQTELIRSDLVLGWTVGGSAWDPVLAGRWEEDVCSSEMKMGKEQGKKKVKTREEDNERVIYAVSSSAVSLHYEKSVLRQNEPTTRVSKHYDLRERESNEVELGAWLWLFQHKGSLELKPSIWTRWAFMIVKT